jgi:hypothetical protein
MNNRDPIFPVARTNNQGKRIQEQHDNLRPAATTVQSDRLGTIVRFVQEINEYDGSGVLFVGIQFDDTIVGNTKDTYGRLFLLGNSVDEIAIIYGNDIVGKRCRVQYVGTRKDQGTAYMANPEGKGNLEKASTIPGFGTFLSPAGKS